MDNHVVIMAGGIGSRFWPMSTPECPKQFIDVMGCGRSFAHWVLLPGNARKQYLDLVKKHIGYMSQKMCIRDSDS